MVEYRARAGQGRRAFGWGLILFEGGVTLVRETRRKGRESAHGVESRCRFRSVDMTSLLAWRKQAEGGRNGL